MEEHIIEDREFTIETPVGSISSDSGNHITDVVSVLSVVVILYAGKIISSAFLRRYFGK